MDNKTNFMICPSCGEVLEYSSKVWEEHYEQERRVWIDKAHKAFDCFWQCGLVSRSQAYSWLAKELDMPFEDAHFRYMSVDQCKRTVALCEFAKAKMFKAFCETTWSECKINRPYDYEIGCKGKL